MFSDFTNVSEDLIVIGSCRLPIFSLVLGTRSCLETVYVRVIDISEKYSRLTK